jgi:hypothetical protein
MWVTVAEMFRETEFSRPGNGVTCCIGVFKHLNIGLIHEIFKLKLEAKIDMKWYTGFLRVIPVQRSCPFLIFRTQFS